MEKDNEKDVWKEQIKKKEQIEQITEEIVQVKPGLFLPKNQLNQFGRPKQQVQHYQMNQQMIKQAQLALKNDYLLSQQIYQQAIQNTGKNWDKFYKHHTNKFFNDRNYLDRELPYIKQLKQGALVELGCGVGNAIFPLKKQYPGIKYYGCDFSQNAIKLINQKVNKEKIQNVYVKVVDLVKDQIPMEWQKGDIITLIFVLSAIRPTQHKNVFQKIFNWMKAGSIFYFRDYGRYDFGQLNLTRKKNKKIKQNFYVKKDGICVYYFDMKKQVSRLCRKKLILECYKIGRRVQKCIEYGCSVYSLKNDFILIDFIIKNQF